MGRTEAGDSNSKSCCTLVRPFTSANLVSYYAPVVGSASYGLLSINVLNPALNTGLISKRDATNILLASTILGTGCYIYTRPHLQDVKSNKLLYAGYGSLIFTFGSVLTWAILRSILPNNVAVGTAAGLASCYALAKTGRDYLEIIDAQITKK